MGKEIRNRSIRFYMEKEEDRKAWEILHSDEMEDFSSVNAFVVAAINDFYERNLRKQDDPYFETREKEDAFAERIISTVEEKILANLSTWIGNIILSGLQIPHKVYPDSGEELYRNSKKYSNQKESKEEKSESDFISASNPSLEPEENDLLDMGAVFF